MANDFIIRQLEDLAQIVGGGTPPTGDPENYGGSIPWLTPKDLSDYQGRFIDRGERNITEKGMKASAARWLPKGSVLFTSRAPIGYVAIAENPVTTNQGFKSLIPKDPSESEFLYYLMKFATPQIQSIGVGSTFAEISGGALKNFAVNVPADKAERVSIGNVLGSLDDKIDLNRRMNETLEAMARAIFKDWFVDFGPVRAKAEGRQPPGLAADIAALFPDKLDDDDKPVGWKIGTVGECFHLTMGQSPPGSTYNDAGDGLPFFQGRTDFGFRYPENRKYCSAPTRIAQQHDTLISVRAPVGDINMAWEKCCLGRGVAALRHNSTSISFTYYSAWAIQQELQQYEHTGTVFGAINKKQFEALKTIEPMQEIVCVFSEYVGVIDRRIRANVIESRTLAQTRDLLLPKLMSGEIRLKDAEKAVEQVL